MAQHDHDHTIAEMLAGVERLVRAVDRTTSVDLAAWHTPINHALRELSQELLSVAFPLLDPAGVLDVWVDEGAQPGGLADVARRMHEPTALVA